MKLPSLQARRAVQWLRRNWTELMGLAGWAMLVRGVALIYVPAAWIVAGFGLMAAAFLLSRKAD